MRCANRYAKIARKSHSRRSHCSTVFVVASIIAVALAVGINNDRNPNDGVSCDITEDVSESESARVCVCERLSARFALDLHFKRSLVRFPRTLEILK